MLVFVFFNFILNNLFLLSLIIKRILLLIESTIPVIVATWMFSIVCFTRLENFSKVPYEIASFKASSDNFFLAGWKLFSFEFTSGDLAVASNWSNKREVCWGEVRRHFQVSILIWSFSFKIFFSLSQRCGTIISKYKWNVLTYYFERKKLL